MSTPITDLAHWREKFRQQRLSNARSWLEEIGKASDPNTLAVVNYDNILRAIEMTLEHEDSFDVGYDLLQGVYQIAFELADWDRWLIYLRDALAMSQKLKEKTNQAYLHDWTASLLLALGRQDEAEPHLQKALQLYLETDEVSRYSRVFPKLSRIHIIRGEFSRSLELCQEALRLGESRQDKAIIADAYFGLSDLYYRRRDWVQSQGYAEKAMAIYEELDQQNLLFRVWSIVIGCQTSLGFLDEAEKEAQKLLDILTSPENALENIFNVVQLRTTMGTIAFKQEDYRTAETHWQEALQLNTLIGFQEGAIPLRNNLGKAYTQMGEWEEARLMFTEALPLYKKFGDTYGWGNCMDNVADLYEAQKDYASCRKTLQEALDYLEPFQDQSHIRELCQMMCERLERLSTKPFVEET